LTSRSVDVEEYRDIIKKQANISPCETSEMSKLGQIRHAIDRSLATIRRDPNS
jgi:hypothetical protein